MPALTRMKRVLIPTVVSATVLLTLPAVDAFAAAQVLELTSSNTRVRTTPVLPTRAPTTTPISGVVVHEGAQFAPAKDGVGAWATATVGWLLLAAVALRRRRTLRE